MALPKLKLPARIWTIADVVGISDGAWRTLAWIAGIVGFCAIATNFTMVVAYAIGIAIEAPMFLNPTRNVLVDGANFVFGVGQVLVAGMLQLGTDFCLLFAAGLAKSKYRITPTVALVLWVICAANTVEMKTAAYEAIGSTRNAEAARVAAAAMPADVSAAKALLAGYVGKPAPPELKISQAVIDGSAAANLEAERKEKVAARDAEVQTGRGTRWETFDLRIAAIDGELASLGGKVEAAKIALAQREAFDKATDKATEWDTRTKATGNVSHYDDPVAIALRTWGLTVLSLLSILVAFAAEKAAHDAKEAAEMKRKRSEAGYRAAATRAENANTFDAEWREAAPAGAPKLPEPEPGEVAQVVSGVNSPVKRARPGSPHPDKAGDDYGAGANGYVEGGKK